MYPVIVLACSLMLLFGLSACAVGPGTPLVSALKTEPGRGSGNVPAPDGYAATVYTGESSGLINPKDREETEAYLETLAPQ